MDSRIKASIIPAWFILISLKLIFINCIIQQKFKKVNYKDKQKFEYSAGMNGQGIRPYAAGEKPRLHFCSRGKIYPCFFRFSELLARTAEVIWMKSLTYFFTFSPLR